MGSVRYDAGMSDRSSIADVVCGQLERSIFCMQWEVYTSIKLFLIDNHNLLADK